MGIERENRWEGLLCLNYSWKSRNQQLYRIKREAKKTTVSLAALWSYNLEIWVLIPLLTF